MTKSDFCGIFLIIFISNGVCTAGGGYCYMMSQAKCERAWTNLWIASHENHLSKICQYFGDVHTCTMDYMVKCQFLPQERELYETDIVKIYTRKPYSCELLGGNIKYQGQYNSSTVEKISLHLYLSLLLMYLHT